MGALPLCRTMATRRVDFHTLQVARESFYLDTR